MHPSVLAVQTALRERGAVGEVRLLDESARTATQAATALGCPVGAIASSLVFLADGEPLLVMTSGAHRVDTTAVAALLNVGAVTKADPGAVRQATGQVIGGVAPIGHPRSLPTLVDTTLATHDVVWAAAGHTHAVFATTYDELLRLTGGRPAQVAG